MYFRCSVNENDDHITSFISQIDRSNEWILILRTQASGLTFDFPHSDHSTYFAGTEEGAIHKCSCSYNEQYLDTYAGHTGWVINAYILRIGLGMGTEWNVIHQGWTVPLTHSYASLSRRINKWMQCMITLFLGPCIASHARRSTRRRSCRALRTGRWSSGQPRGTRPFRPSTALTSARCVTQFVYLKTIIEESIRLWSDDLMIELIIHSMFVVQWLIPHSPQWFH